MTYTIEVHREEKGYYLEINRNPKSNGTKNRIITADSLDDLATKLSTETIKAPTIFQIKYCDGISKIDLRSRMYK